MWRSVNPLTLNIYNKLELDNNDLTEISYPLVDLGDKTMTILCTVNLPFVLGDEKYK